MNIKGKENNAKKKVRDAKECVIDVRSSHPSKKNNYISLVKETYLFNRAGKVTDNFPPLSSH